MHFLSWYTNFLSAEQIQTDISSCENDIKRVTDAIEGYKGSERELAQEIDQTEVHILDECHQNVYSLLYSKN